MAQSNTRSKKRTNRRTKKRINRGGNKQDFYYEVLKVDKNSSNDDIVKAYKDQMKELEEKLKNGNNNDATKGIIKDVKTAYNTLKDKKKREEYDNKLAGPEKKLAGPDKKLLEPDKKLAEPDKKLLEPDKKLAELNNNAEQIQKTNPNGCPSNVFDLLIDDLNNSYFKKGDNMEPDPDYTINKKHNIKIRAYPSIFSTDSNPIHLYTKLTDDVTYGNIGDQYVTDALAIDEMFELVNLQQYFRDPYNGEEENDQRNNCNTKNSEESKTDKCKSFKKHKKYKKMNETPNKIKDFEYEENIKVNKLFKNTT